MGGELGDKEICAVPVGSLGVGLNGISARALELALKFLERANCSVSPGDLLEVAALIEGYITKGFHVEYRANKPPADVEGEVFSLFDHVRAVVIPPEQQSEGAVTLARLEDELKDRKFLFDQLEGDLNQAQCDLTARTEQLEKIKSDLAVLENKVGQKTHLLCLAEKARKQSDRDLSERTQKLEHVEEMLAESGWRVRQLRRKVKRLKTTVMWHAAMILALLVVFFFMGWGG